MNADERLKFLRDLEKLKASGVKSEDYTSALDKDINLVKGSRAASEPITRIKNSTPHIDTKSASPLLKGEEFMDKIAHLKALKGAGKKALSLLPFAGAATAALQGDPAMAAEEAIMDLPGAEVLRSESVGQSPEEEALMLAEDKARKNYKESTAYRDRRGISEEEELPEQIKNQRKAGFFSKLGRMMGKE